MKTNSLWKIIIMVMVILLTEISLFGMEIVGMTLEKLKGHKETVVSRAHKANAASRANRVHKVR